MSILMHSSHFGGMIFAPVYSNVPCLKRFCHLLLSPQRVYERVARRALQTGRDIPRALLDDTMQQVLRSVEVLGPLADFCATIQNNVDGAAPVFARINSFRALMMSTTASAPDADEASK
jgi:hypothetical protein